MSFCVVKKMTKWILISVLEFIAISISIACFSFGLVRVMIWIEDAGWKDIAGYIWCVFCCIMVMFVIVDEIREQYRAFKRECEG